MACFVAPLAEAIVTTAVTKVVKSKETDSSTDHIKFSEKLGWLNKMLWGGSALLAAEHIWHGEVIASFPFLTAIKDGEVSGMLHEIATTGVLMAVLVTAVWAGMVVVSKSIEKKSAVQAIKEKV